MMNKQANKVRRIAARLAKLDPETSRAMSFYTCLKLDDIGLEDQYNDIFKHRNSTSWLEVEIIGSAFNGSERSDRLRLKYANEIYEWRLTALCLFADMIESGDV